MIWLVLAGGYQYDGGQTIADIDESQLRAAVDSAISAGVYAFVVCGVFSPVNKKQEEEAAKLIEAHIISRHHGTHAKITLH